ncbi:hypothetical protein [Mucilaginibacter sp. UR6-11]|uniref:hypothetical protein n=1 Tax=Mucilaginibacter sp. UR6-11 TaxID=1435644 RepID=UPI001E5DC7F6|nr:hypothetical protein [Mucilaginibacter sp. UR6-11]MCC8426578.1 hypothetical protein [Mucilaginibacter sp. UR6-11]
MLIVTTRILISQTPSKKYPDRNREFDLDFVVEIEANNSWRDFTDGCKITLPKNFKYVNTTGQAVYPNNVTGIGSNIGGFDVNSTPLFLRGDQVTVIAGYKYKLGNQNFVDTATIFEGYISRVSSKKPFVLECEDNMWKLKQLPAPNKLFKAREYTLESMMAELLAGSPFTVNRKESTPIDDFRALNESVMDIIARMHKDFNIYAYFIGNELYIGHLVIYQNPGNNYKFIFQENIIEDELEYNRKDDIVLSAVGYSTNTIKTAGITKDGATKTKKQRIEVLVTLQNDVFTATKTLPGQKAEYPPNFTGERRTIYYPGTSTDVDKIIKYTEQELKRHYYDGFTGKFTTFGIPFCKQGDNAEIYDAILPERNGTYKIKGVEYKLSVEGGLRQIIELDYRIGDNKDPMPRLS